MMTSAKRRLPTTWKRLLVSSNNDESSSASRRQMSASLSAHSMEMSSRRRRSAVSKLFRSVRARKALYKYIQGVLNKIEADLLSARNSSVFVDQFSDKVCAYKGMQGAAKK